MHAGSWQRGLPCLATLPAMCKRCPKSCSSRSVELLSCVKRPLCLGMTRKCVGACGEMSLNARLVSSSYMMLAGISLEMILSKIVGASLPAALQACCHSAAWHQAKCATKTDSRPILRQGIHCVERVGWDHPDSAASFAAFSSDMARICKPPRFFPAAPKILKLGRTRGNLPLINADVDTALSILKEVL